MYSLASPSSCWGVRHWALGRGSTLIALLRYGALFGHFWDGRADCVGVALSALSIFSFGQETKRPDTI